MRPFILLYRYKMRYYTIITMQMVIKLMELKYDSKAINKKTHSDLVNNGKIKNLNVLITHLHQILQDINAIFLNSQ